jgi:DNA-binding NtrC family response regulator
MTAPPHVLVVDDERSIRLMLETGLSLNGFQVTCVRSGQEAIELASTRVFDAVLSDIFMPDSDGFEVLASLRESNPKIPIILMTAQGSVETAMAAISRGATDFIGKPFDVAEVVALLRRYLQATQEAALPSQSIASAADSDWITTSGIVGRSAPMAAVYKSVAQAARSDATALVIGESGTGKELVARGIHDYSARSKKPFVSVNCAGLTDTLLEAEMFGHVRGAFTGASSDRAGLFETADGGTLFLDELGSTSPMFQASLLRALQTGEVRRVGSPHVRHVNVRVIGASNAPLRQLIDAGSFRADLFYRLSVFTIELPPLRSRPADVPLLTNYFIRRFCEPDQPIPHLTRETMDALAAYSFPGNVRELENAIRRAVALSSHGLITIDSLPPEIVNASKSSPNSPRSDAVQRLIEDRPSMDEVQRRYLELVLEETGGNRRRTAGILNLDRRTVQRLIARYKLQAIAGPDNESEYENHVQSSSELIEHI